MEKRLGNARSLSAMLRNVLAIAGASLVCAMSVSSCGGKTAEDETGDAETDAGTNADRCAIVGRSDVGGSAYCGSWTVYLKSGATAASCGFPDSGYGATDDVCERFCGPALSGAVLVCAFSASETVSCSYSCVVDGRRPEGLGDAPTDRATLGAWLATMAFHEAASVHAFAILRDELRAHDAPRPLLRSIERARLDEIRHARSAARLSRRYGATPARPRVRRSPPRDLRSIALENAREGCGRELLGALVGLHQAKHARTPELRAFYSSIARDELRHAALSWRMHTWMMTRLPRAAREAVESELRAALRSFVIDADDRLRDELGLPTRDELRAYAAGVVDLVRRAPRDLAQRSRPGRIQAMPGLPLRGE